MEINRNLELEIKKCGNSFKCVEDENAIYRNKGLIDAFTLHIPEQTGKEFFEYIPHLKDDAGETVCNSRI